MSKRMTEGTGLRILRALDETPPASAAAQTRFLTEATGRAIVTAMGGTPPDGPCAAGQYITEATGEAILAAAEGGGGGGGSIITDYASLISFPNADFMSAGIDEVSINSNYSGDFSIRNMFYNTKIKKVTVTAPSLTVGQFTFQSSTVEEIELNSGSGYVTGEFQSFLHQASHAKKVLGSPLDLYTSTNTNMFYYASALEEIRFKPSSITNSINLQQSANLSTDTLVSLANGLRSDVSSKTLTLHNTVKSGLASITGTVSDGVFTADAGGLTTLQDFITTTKGWTVA